MRKNNVKSYNTQPPFLQTMHWTVEIDCGFRSETTINVTKNEVQYRISNMPCVMWFPLSWKVIGLDLV